MSHAATAGPKRLHPFELERADLGHENVAWLGALGGGHERNADAVILSDVSADVGLATTGLADRAQHRRRRRLSVRPGDRENRRTADSVADLDLRPNRYVLRQCLLDGGSRSRDARTRYDQIGLSG